MIITIFTKLLYVQCQVEELDEIPKRSEITVRWERFAGGAGIILAMVSTILKQDVVTVMSHNQNDISWFQNKNCLKEVKAT